MKLQDCPKNCQMEEYAACCNGTHCKTHCICSCKTCQTDCNKNEIREARPQQQVAAG